MSKQPKESSEPAVSQVAAFAAANGVSEEVRHVMIDEAAYFIAEHRDFQSDAALDDWLRAEAEIDAHLSVGGRSPRAASVSITGE